MGLLICKKHGETLRWLEIEDVICEKIKNGEEIPAGDIGDIIIKYVDEDTSEAYQVYRYIVSRQTMIKEGFKNEYLVANDEDTAALPSITTHIMCLECLSEYPYIDNLKDII
jgi:hypothetical protein